MYSRENPAGSQGNPHYSRYLELLEALKKEYDVLAYDPSNANIGLRAYREELEQKIQAQLSEVAFMQKTIVELERAYLKMKTNYEDEISRLRKELESRTLTSQVTLGLSNTNVPAIPAFIMNSNLPNHAPGSMISLPQIDPSIQSAVKRARMEDAALAGQQPSPQSASGSMSGGKSPNVSTSYTGRVSANASGLMHPNGAGGEPTYEARRKQSGILNSMQSGYSGTSHPGTHPAGVMPSAQGASLPLRRSPSVDASAPVTLEQNAWRVSYNPKVFKGIEVNLRETFMHREVVSCVKFSPNGALLATGSNKLISLFDTTTFSLYAELEIPNSYDKEIFIRSVSFSPDSKRLAVGSEDCLIRVWDLESRAIIHSISCHNQEVYAVEFTPDGRYVVSGSGDRTIKIIDIEQGEAVATLDAFPSLPAQDCKDYGITSIALSNDGSLIASGCIDRVIRIWHFATRRLVCALKGHGNTIYSLCFSPDSRYIASGSLDKTIILWERQPDATGPQADDDTEPGISFELNSTITCHSHFVLSVVFTPDNKYIVSCSKDMTIHVWNISANTTQLVLEGHTDTVFSVSVSNDAKLLASGSGDKSARIWEMATFESEEAAAASFVDASEPAADPTNNPSNGHSDQEVEKKEGSETLEVEADS